MCKRRAPILSVSRFTSKAICAIRSIASWVKMILTFSVPTKAIYCLIKALFGSVRILTKSSAERSFNSTRIGKRPCNSGIKSLGFDKLKAPLAINRMWSVWIAPYFVLTWEPSTIGRISRWTPSRETSPEFCCDFEVILSISSMKIIPELSANLMAAV